VTLSLHFENRCEQYTSLWLHSFYVINKFIVALIPRYMQMMPEITREFVYRACILGVKNYFFLRLSSYVFFFNTTFRKFVLLPYSGSGSRTNFRHVVVFKNT
jgi:hypothetical protein